MHVLTARQRFLIILSMVLLMTTPLFTACDDDDEDKITSITTTTEPSTTAMATQPTTTTEATTTTTEPTGNLITIDSPIGELLDNPDCYALLEKNRFFRAWMILFCKKAGFNAPPLKRKTSGI